MYIYYQRRQRPDKSDWETRVLATTDMLVNELRVAANVIISISTDAETLTLIYDPNKWYTKENEAHYWAAILVFGEGIAEGARFMIREKGRKEKTNIEMKEVYPGSPQAPMRSKN